MPRLLRGKDDPSEAEESCEAEDHDVSAVVGVKGVRGVIEKRIGRKRRSSGRGDRDRW